MGRVHRSLLIAILLIVPIGFIVPVAQGQTGSQTGTSPGTPGSDKRSTESAPRSQDKDVTPLATESTSPEAEEAPPPSCEVARILAEAGLADKAEAQYIKILEANPKAPSPCAENGLRALADQREGPFLWRWLKRKVGPIAVLIGSLLRALIILLGIALMTAAVAFALAYLAALLSPWIRRQFEKVWPLKVALRRRLRLIDFGDPAGEGRAGAGKSMAALVRSEMLKRASGSGNQGLFLASDDEALTIPTEILQATPQLKFLGPLIALVQNLMSWNMYTIRGQLLASEGRGDGITVVLGTRRQSSAACTLWAKSHGGPPPAPEGKDLHYESLAVPVAAWVLHQYQGMIESE